MTEKFRFAPVVLLAAMILLLQSCSHTYVGEGVPVSETRSVGKFNAIALNMNAIVNVSDSMEHSCNVVAQQNLQEAIIIRTDGSTLVITNKGTIVSDEPIVINVSMSRAAMFEVNGSGKVIGLNTLKNEKMDFEVNGSGSINLDVVTTKIACAATGSGVLELSGSTNSFDAEINGSGVIKAYDLSALTSKVKVNGSGEAFVNVGETLKATIAGSGVIKYKGQPKIDESVSGSGTIEQTN